MSVCKPLKRQARINFWSKINFSPPEVPEHSEDDPFELPSIHFQRDRVWQTVLFRSATVWDPFRSVHSYRLESQVRTTLLVEILSRESKSNYRRPIASPHTLRLSNNWRSPESEISLERLSVRASALGFLSIYRRVLFTNLPSSIELKRIQFSV